MKLICVITNSYFIIFFFLICTMLQVWTELWLTKRHLMSPWQHRLSQMFSQTWIKVSWALYRLTHCHLQYLVPCTMHLFRPDRQWPYKSFSVIKSLVLRQYIGRYMQLIHCLRATNNYLSQCYINIHVNIAEQPVVTIIAKLTTRGSKKNAILGWALSSLCLQNC